VDAIAGVYRKVMTGHKNTTTSSTNTNGSSGGNSRGAVVEHEGDAEGAAGAVGPDSEFALTRSGAVHIPRFEWMSVSEELAAWPDGAPHSSSSSASAKKLEIGKRGSLKTLQWVEASGLKERTLQGEEVMLEVRATGMNFKVRASVTWS
jgi:hypothetical protein